MRIVVTVIRPGTRHPDRLGAHLQIPDERPVEPLAAVVEDEAPNRKRQRLLNVFGLFQHPVGTLVPYRPALRPGAGQVGIGQAPDETAGQAAPAVGDAVGLQEAQPLLVPHLALDRHLAAQERAWTRPTEPAAHPRPGVGQ